MRKGLALIKSTIFFKKRASFEEFCEILARHMSVSDVTENASEWRDYFKLMSRHLQNYTAKIAMEESVQLVVIKDFETRELVMTEYKALEDKTLTKSYWKNWWAAHWVPITPRGVFLGGLSFLMSTPPAAYALYMKFADNPAALEASIYSDPVVASAAITAQVGAYSLFMGLIYGFYKNVTWTGPFMWRMAKLSVFSVGFNLLLILQVDPMSMLMAAGVANFSTNMVFAQGSKDLVYSVARFREQFRLNTTEHLINLKKWVHRNNLVRILLSPFEKHLPRQIPVKKSELESQMFYFTSTLPKLLNLFGVVSSWAYGASILAILPVLRAYQKFLRQNYIALEKNAKLHNDHALQSTYKRRIADIDLALEKSTLSHVAKSVLLKFRDVHQAAIKLGLRPAAFFSEVFHFGDLAGKIRSKQLMREGDEFADKSDRQSELGIEFERKKLEFWKALIPGIRTYLLTQREISQVELDHTKYLLTRDANNETLLENKQRLENEIVQLEESLNAKAIGLHTLEAVKTSVANMTRVLSVTASPVSWVLRLMSGALRQSSLLAIEKTGFDQLEVRKAEIENRKFEKQDGDRDPNDDLEDSLRSTSSRLRSVAETISLGCMGVLL